MELHGELLESADKPLPEPKLHSPDHLAAPPNKQNVKWDIGQENRRMGQLDPMFREYEKQVPVLLD
jgi:hypothetical protein